LVVEISSNVLHPVNHKLKVYLDMVNTSQNPLNATETATLQVQYGGCAPHLLRIFFTIIAYDMMSLA
jgi:hypothetical protein